MIFAGEKYRASVHLMRFDNAGQTPCSQRVTRELPTEIGHNPMTR
jgi:hypothetical protein